MNKISFYGNKLFTLIEREIYLFKTYEKCREIMEKNNFYFYELKNEFNIHILCSHKDIESLILSLVSFYISSEKHTNVVLHGDGTVTKRDLRIIKKIFPSIKFISLKKADNILRRKGFSEETIQFRHKHKLMIKAIDFHWIQSKERILSLDTDVFFLDKADELWDHIENNKQFVFNHDPASAYGSARKLMKKVLDKKLKVNNYPYVNTGLIVEPSHLFRENKEIIEKYCLEFKDFGFKRKHCVEQGFVAMFLKDKQVEEIPLSDKFKVIGSRNKEGIRFIKNYNFKKNPDSVQTIHLCGWDKLGNDMRIVKNKLLEKIDKN